MPCGVPRHAKRPRHGSIATVQLLDESERVPDIAIMPASDEQRASGRPFLLRPLLGAKQACSWRTAA